MSKKLFTQDKKIIDSIRSLSIDMIDNAGTGHPGIALGAATILYTLYSRHMDVNPNDDKWLNRDRLVMSAGHGSALLYATLLMCGFDITVDDLKKFRRIESKTPGHPEYGVTPGVDMTTGLLGQGIASAVGLAMGETILSEKYMIDKKNSLFDYYTYVLCSDGDLMEGVSYEACSLAGSYKLGKLIVLYDSNNVTLDGKTEGVFDEDVLKRFDALGWHTQLVRDGENICEIDDAISRAKKVKDKPSFIQVKTMIGYGSLLAGSNSVHGTPLTKDDITQLKNKLDIRTIPFAISQDVCDEFKKLISDRASIKYNEWSLNYNTMVQRSDDGKASLEKLLKNDSNLNVNLMSLINAFDPEMKESMRDTNGKIMNVIADNLPIFMGGNADVASSTKAYLNKFQAYGPVSHSGRNINFGVREHAMGSILNGLALSGFRVFGGTFLSFADYLKPAIRMAALMDLPVTYIFTHDSIGVGQDGPTHQPVEQLAMLRSIPNLNVYRPADAKEIVGVWNNILNSRNPSALVISRNEMILFKDTDPISVSKGAYIVRNEVRRLSGIIIATGSEVSTAMLVAKNLYEKGLDLRVVSMPCIEKFLEQDSAYKEKLFPLGTKIVVVEAGTSYGWHRFVYNDKYLITVNEFGKSGTRDEVLKYCEFDFATISKKIEKLFM